MTTEITHTKAENALASKNEENEFKTLQKKRRKILIGSFILFVILPTFLTGFYYAFIATPQYISESKITVSVENKNIGALDGLGGLLSAASGGGGPLAGLHDAFIVKEYIESADMMQSLRDEIGLYDIYAGPDPDMFSAPPDDPTKEAFLRYYRDMISVRLDEMTGLLSVSVHAFSPEDSRKIAAEIITHAENFVNLMSERMQKDSVAFAYNFLKESENKILELNRKISQFRNQNANFDPTATATGVLKIASGLEAELARVRTEIATLGAYMKSDNPRLQSLRAKEESIARQIDAQTERLASREGSTLANIAQEYEALKLKNEFAVKQYGAALTAFEEAQVGTRRQTKYLIRVVGPTIPEESLEPLPLYDTFTVFIGCLALYIVGGLIIAGVRDHIRT